MPHQLVENHPDLATALELLDKWIQHTLYKTHQPGLAAAVVYDGELLWGKGFGYANLKSKTPVTLDTRFRIASISKTFTATAIMQLRDAGKLSLDDPVSAHLDWFNLRYEDAPEITIRNLLTHSSGLPRDSHGPMWTEHKAPLWDEFVAATKKRRPTRPPYDKYAYSNLGYSLLGGIIEAISGLSWAEYMQKHIVDPLGMSETRPTPSGDDPLLATGYSRADENYQRREMPFFLMNGFEASANFASSVNDLVKYAKFHLSKGQTPILSGHTLRDMHRVHWLHPNWKEGYGLGISILRVNGWEISGHGGGYTGYLTRFSVCRDHNMGCIILTNALGSNPVQYMEQAYKLVLPELVKATAKARPAANPDWQQYLGTYLNDWDDFEVVIRGGELQLISVELIDESPAILEPTDEPHIFIIREPQQSNETARFEFDDSGKVARLWYRNEYTIRKQ